MFYINIPLKPVPEHEPFNGTRFVVKMQRPVDGSLTFALIYNKDRQVEVNAPLSRELLLLFGEKFKIFRWASLRNGKLSINEGAPWQKW